MESKSFPSNFDIAGRYAKHRKMDYLRYSELGEYFKDLSFYELDSIRQKISE